MNNFNLHLWIQYFKNWTFSIHTKKLKRLKYLFFKFVDPFTQKSNPNKKNIELDPSLMLKLPSSFSWISLEQVMHSGAKTDEKSSSLVSSFKKHQPH